MLLHVSHTFGSVIKRETQKKWNVVLKINTALKWPITDCYFHTHDRLLVLVNYS